MGNTMVKEWSFLPIYRKDWLKTKARVMRLMKTMKDSDDFCGVGLNIEELNCEIEGKVYGFNDARVPDGTMFTSGKVEEIKRVSSDTVKVITERRDLYIKFANAADEYDIDDSVYDPYEDEEKGLFGGGADFF